MGQVQETADGREGRVYYQSRVRLEFGVCRGGGYNEIQDQKEIPDIKE